MFEFYAHASSHVRIEYCLSIIDSFCLLQVCASKTTRRSSGRRSALCSNASSPPPPVSTARSSVPALAIILATAPLTSRPHSRRSLWSSGHSRTSRTWIARARTRASTSTRPPRRSLTSVPIQRFQTWYTLLYIQVLYEHMLIYSIEIDYCSVVFSVYCTSK